MGYSVGDCLGIIPYNNPKEVEEFLRESIWDMNKNVEIIKNSIDILNNGPLSIKQLFTEILDIFGKPSRKF